MVACESCLARCLQHSSGGKCPVLGSHCSHGQVTSLPAVQVRYITAGHAATVTPAAAAAICTLHRPTRLSVIVPSHPCSTAANTSLCDGTVSSLLPPQAVLHNHLRTALPEEYNRRLKEDEKNAALVAQVSPFFPLSRQQAVVRRTIWP